MVSLYDTMLNGRRIPYLCEKELLCEERVIANSPDLVVKAANDFFQLNNRSEEYLYMFAMSSKSELIGAFEVSHGTVNATLVTPREVFLKALMCGAVNITLIHNHPSGDCTPSKEDVELCARVCKAGDLIGIHVLDFIINGNNEYYSFAELEKI